MGSNLSPQLLVFLDCWLKLRYERCDLPGFVVAIAHKGKVVFNKAYGYANLEKKKRLSPGHIFRVASHAKTFTSTAIMQLAEAGKLSIDDRVIKFLPWLKEHKDKRVSKVTIRQLMCHGAGVIRDGLDSDYWQLLRSFPNDKQFKKEILEADLALNPNKQLKYSNFGYGLLGMIVEAASGVPYNQYVDEHIIQALGLKSTAPDYLKSIEGKLVTGYSRADIQKTRQPIARNIVTSSLSPATGFCSTAEDLCNYFTAHFIGSKKLLLDKSKKEMQRTQWRRSSYSGGRRDYGLGFNIEYFGQRRLFGHTGGVPGHISHTLCDPKEKLIVTVLINCMDLSALEINKKIFQVIDFFQENSRARAPKHTRISKHARISKNNLEKFQGIFMNLWGIGQILNVGNKLIAFCPDSWDPFDKVEELKYVTSNTFKISSGPDAGNPGELVHFNFAKNGRINSIVYGGSTMWLPAKYLRVISRKKVISG